MFTTSANQTSQFEIRTQEIYKIELLTSCWKSSLSDCPASLNPAALCILLESNPLLCCPNVISCPFCTQTPDLSYPIPSLVSHLVPLSHLVSAFKSLSLPVLVEQVKGWMQLLVTSLTCSLEPTSHRTEARAGHRKNWVKFGRSRTAFHRPGADLGPAKLHWLHICRKMTYPHIHQLCPPILVTVGLW